MCTAKATLVYSLTVHSSSFVFAANAWIRLSQTFNFFDLLMLRRRTGNLITQNKHGRGAFTEVPEEIWEEIKKYNVLEELAVSEDHFLRPLICNNWRCQVTPAPGAGVTWEKLVDVDEEDCSYTWERLEQFVSDDIMTWSRRTVNVSFSLPTLYPAYTTKGLTSRPGDSRLALDLQTCASNSSTNSHQRRLVRSYSSSAYLSTYKPPFRRLTSTSSRSLLWSKRRRSRVIR
ncbi:hypothetical protein JCM5350_000368 [Sporobolomyces pararoseus]